MRGQPVKPERKPEPVDGLCGVSLSNQEENLSEPVYSPPIPTAPPVTAAREKTSESKINKISARANFLRSPVVARGFMPPSVVYHCQSVATVAVCRLVSSSVVILRCL